MRNPEVNLDQTLSYVFYRPEIGARLGYLISDRVNVHVQYAHIFGPEHGPAVGAEVESLPNTLYKVDSLTIGATYYW